MSFLLIELIARINALGNLLDVVKYDWKNRHISRNSDSEYKAIKDNNNYTLL